METKFALPSTPGNIEQLVAAVLVKYDAQLEELANIGRQGRRRIVKFARRLELMTTVGTIPSWDYKVWVLPIITRIITY